MVLCWFEMTGSATTFNQVRRAWREELSKVEAPRLPTRLVMPVLRKIARHHDLETSSGFLFEAWVRGVDDGVSSHNLEYRDGTLQVIANQNDVVTVTKYFLGSKASEVTTEFTVDKHAPAVLRAAGFKRGDRAMWVTLRSGGKRVRRLVPYAPSGMEPSPLWATSGLPSPK
jgi:hypothetical protein